MIIIPTEKSFDWKHAPIALFTIVLLNIFFFFSYQMDDQKKITEALIDYQRFEFFQHEWTLYQEYLKASDQLDMLEDSQFMYEEGEVEVLSVSMLMDFEFYEYLRDHSERFFQVAKMNEFKAREWSIERRAIHNKMKQVSSIAHGLIPKEIGIFDVISHQFLHGDIMHLVGNMFFLVVCGFAVEAAIGSLKFTGFYLLSGIVGGLSHCFIDLQSTVPLIGASGAISGVMAMYLAIFRLKKIEFFYWIFAFVGYFKAPALLILPVYIGMELFNYFAYPDSNVAFMAHAGGFVAGAAAIAITLKIQPLSTALNQEYVEQDTSIDPAKEKLAKIYSSIDSYSFSTALNLLNQYLEEEKNTFDLQFLKYTLCKLTGNDQLTQSLIELFSNKRYTEEQLHKLSLLWREYADVREELDDDHAMNIALNMVSHNMLELAEGIFSKIYRQNKTHTQLGVLAKKLALLYGEQNNHNKQLHFNQIAEQLIGGSNG